MNSSGDFTGIMAMLLRDHELLEQFARGKGEVAERLAMDAETAGRITHLDPEELRVQRDILLHKRMSGCRGPASSTWSCLAEPEKIFHAYADAHWPSRGTGGIADSLGFLEFIRNASDATVRNALDRTEYNRLRFLAGESRLVLRFVSGFNTERGSRPALQILAWLPGRRLFERILHPAI